jgi:hypothetical protein
MEINQDLSNSRGTQQSSSKPVMSQEAAKKGYSNTTAPAGNYDAFFKEKILTP